ncbi:MAG: ATPase domain-containing protein [Candidatus Bathyarchaeia archaeon]|nr:AAA family ATPase [Candidatus Bathyarchaeota archaeon]
MERISTGSDVLDLVFEGGFPAGSLIAITGSPGSGKTIFAANWIYSCIKKFDRNGLYVSFVESRKSFIENMRRLGLKFEDLELEGKFKFLEMVTLKEAGLPVIFEEIISEISNMKATALVIDSFSAISQVIEKAQDIRILSHAILNKIVRDVGCTTIMIIEKQAPEEVYEPAEFLADCIIHLCRKEINGTLLRCLKIIKARGTEIRQPVMVFTLKDGFKIFRPLLMGGFKEPIKKFKIVPHGKDYYSSGIRDLDTVIGPMLRRGSYNLLEIERNVTLPIERLLRVIVSNVLNGEGYVVILPPQGLSAQVIFKSLKSFVPEDVLEHNFKVVDVKPTAAEVTKTNVILFEGRSLKEDIAYLWNIISEYRRQRDKPILSILSFDTLEYFYGKDELLKVLGEDLANIRNFGDIRLNIIRSECAIAGHLSALADVHLIVREINGVIFLQGIKPRTPLFNIDLHVDEEGTEIKLIPIL